MKNPPGLTPSQAAIFDEVYPLLDRLNEQLGERIEMLLLTNTARRLVSLGVEPMTLADQVRRAAEHQVAFNHNRRVHKHH